MDIIIIKFTLYSYTTIPLYNYIIYNYIKSPHCSGLSNKFNLQRSRYSRLKWDVDKLKYEKLSKYKFKQPKYIVLGTPKKARKGPRMNLPRGTTNFYVQEYWDITLNTKVGKTSLRCNG